MQKCWGESERSWEMCLCCSNWGAGSQGSRPLGEAACLSTPAKAGKGAHAKRKSSNLNEEFWGVCLRMLSGPGTLWWQWGLAFRLAGSSGRDGCLLPVPCALGETGNLLLLVWPGWSRLETACAQIAASHQNRALVSQNCLRKWTITVPLSVQMTWMFASGLWENALFQFS